ncbi:hypothetical protein C8F01DRAFT_127571 [Mycena amicta]|nr:hypothetical protein C8F01DRAFT_127571 [Mycena amicta]
MNVPSPIQKLPAELLAEIFLNLVGHVVYSHERTIPRAAVRLSSVCMYWRQLALNTPRMWLMPTRLVLDASKESPRYLSMIKQIIERSSPLPLDITIHGQTRSSPPKPTFPPLVAAVVSVAHRWREVSSIHVDIVTPLDAMGFPAFDHLQYVDLVLDETEMPPAIGPPSSLFLHAPHLRRAHLHLADFGRLPMPWAQLTQLSLLDQTTTRSGRLQLLDIVMQCVSVARMYLHVVAWAETEIPGTGNIVCLEHLLDLDIRPTTDEESIPTFDPFFACFGFPALKILFISMVADEDTYLAMGGAFADFLERSPNLESLTLEYCDMDSALLDRILFAISSSSITALTLRYCFDCVTNAFFKRLTYNHLESTSPLAPRLHTVNLALVGHDYDEDAVREMILSRWWTDDALQALPAPPLVARWKSIGIHVSSSFYSESFVSMVSRVRAEGLRVGQVIT